MVFYFSLLVHALFPLLKKAGEICISDDVFRKKQGNFHFISFIFKFVGTHKRSKVVVKKESSCISDDVLKRSEVLSLIHFVSFKIWIVVSALYTYMNGIRIRFVKKGGKIELNLKIVCQKTIQFYMKKIVCQKNQGKTIKKCYV